MVFGCFNRGEATLASRDLGQDLYWRPRMARIDDREVHLHMKPEGDNQNL